MGSTVTAYGSTPDQALRNLSDQLRQALQTVLPGSETDGGTQPRCIRPAVYDEEGHLVRAGEWVVAAHLA